MSKYMNASRGTTKPTGSNPAKRVYNGPKAEGIIDGCKKVYGFKLDITDEESNMITLPWRTEERNQVIFEQLKQEKGPIMIYDTHGGVGGDCLDAASASLKYDIRKIRYIITQNSPDAEQDSDQKRFCRMVSNITRYFKINPKTSERMSVKAFNDSSEEFIKTSLKEISSGIDLLYSDPPWDLPKGFDLAKHRGTNTNPSAATITLINRLQNDVYGPLKEINFPPPHYVCIKAPTPFEEFRTALFETSPYLREHSLFKTIPVRNRKGSICMYFHILAYHQDKPAK